MNISELARKLKTTAKELKEILPQAGFDIGKRAIKVDDRIAEKITEQWDQILADHKSQKELDKDEEEEITEKPVVEEIKKINIPKYITVKNFSKVLGLPLSQVIAELMKNGIMASLNERIDFETAKIITEDLEVPVELILIKKEKEKADESVKVTDIMEEKDAKDAKPRPPVIVVMGHVDHGKTKLLDAIRETNVMEGESGGITQHIGAYQAEKQGEKITFIDTPGHEAFTAMRSRGAQVADIAILIVAADDGVMPQTEEAFKIIKNAGLPFIVAINKIDKPEANIEKTKQELTNKLNVVPEEWGGKHIFSLISAKQKKGIDEILDTLILVAELEKDRLNANFEGKMAGTIIDSHVDKGEGPVATILVQTGTLRKNDHLIINNSIYGKVRAMKDFKGNIIDEGTPSTPVKILGFKTLPNVGDIVITEQDSKELKKSKTVSKSYQKYQEETRIIDEQIETSEDEEEKSFNIILKTDVLGSQEAILESLAKLENSDVKTKVVFTGLGNITDTDIDKACSQNAQILGFHVKAPNTLLGLIKEKEVVLKNFEVIYELTEYVEAELNKIIKPKYVKNKLGQVKIKAIFKKDNAEMIVGGMVTKGTIEKNTNTIVKRDGKKIAEGKITALQSNKQDADSVKAGQECGIKYSGKPVIEADDILESWKEELQQNINS